MIKLLDPIVNLLEIQRTKEYVMWYHWDAVSNHQTNENYWINDPVSQQIDQSGSENKRDRKRQTDGGGTC